MADRLALLASTACLVHCLALPLLFAVLPMLSRFISLPESFHLWMVAVTVPVSGYALFKGRRGGGDLRPLSIGFSGLGLLLTGAFIANETIWEVSVTVAGSLVLTAGHIMNWQRRR